MSAESAFTRTWRVGSYRATLSCPKPRAGESLAAVVEWEPTIPRDLSEAELQEYRDGRDAAFRALSREHGISVAVLEP